MACQPARLNKIAARTDAARSANRQIYVIKALTALPHRRRHRAECSAINDVRYCFKTGLYNFQNGLV